MVPGRRRVRYQNHHISNTVPDITPKFFVNDRLHENLRPLRQESPSCPN
jgi:hypothetical protein